MKQHWEWEFDAPRERLWPWIADSDWINAQAGLPKIGTRDEALAGGGTRKIAWFSVGPLRVEWEERPTIWRVPEFYQVDRVYRMGPLARFVNRTALEVLGPERTRVVVDIEMDARNAVTALALPLIAAQGKAGADRAFARAAECAKGAPPATRRGGALFDSLRADGAHADAIDALEAHFALSDERDLATLRPFELADQYGVARKMMLRTCLAAARAGLFNLKWDVICPSCRGTPNAFDSLTDVRADLHCPSCNIPYGPQFDRSVEVTFNARPLGRGVDPPLYCIASPHRSAHVLAQTAVAARGNATIELDLVPGVYDVNAVGVALTPFVVTGNASASRSTARVTADAVEFPHETVPGPATIAIENGLDRETIVRIERGRWNDRIATAAHVTAMQEFRDLFSSEVLAPGLELGIESMAILFTDLVGSTAMYSRAGDAPAFRLVTDHFAVIREIFDRRGGAIVKTIGDAVMGVFTDPAACLEAALEIDGAVRAIEHGGVPLRLRVGLHYGPCIAMRANDRLDYFGTTVNLAARLEAQAGAGEVVLASTVAARDDVARVLAGALRKTQSEAVPVKGFTQPVEIVRILADNPQT
jgi:class 3 adenylate cyclase